jgi:hypothetical protein
VLIGVEMNAVLARVAEERTGVELVQAEDDAEARYSLRVLFRADWCRTGTKPGARGGRLPAKRSTS